MVRIVAEPVKMKPMKISFYKVKWLPNLGDVYIYASIKYDPFLFSLSSFLYWFKEVYKFSDSMLQLF